MKSIKEVLLVGAMVTMVGCGSSGTDTDTEAPFQDDSDQIVDDLRDQASVGTGDVDLINGSGIYSGWITTSDEVIDVQAYKILDALVLQFNPSDNNPMFMVIDIAEGGALFYESESTRTYERAIRTGGGNANLTEDSNYNIVGDLSFGTDEIGTLRLTRETKYTQNSYAPTLADVADTYTRYITGSSTVVSITVDVDGDITGSSTAGCIFSGSITQMESKTNMFGALLDITSCDDAGEYVGAMYIDSERNSNGYQTAFLNVANADKIFYLPLRN